MKTDAGSGTEEEKIYDCERPHYQAKAPDQNVADGGSTFRSARLDGCLDDLIVLKLCHKTPFDPVWSQFKSARPRRVVETWTEV